MGKKIVGLVSVFVLLFLSFAPSFAATMSMEDLLEKVQTNQSKIKDMYAETTTTVTSSIVLPGAEDKVPKKMVQKGKMWTKGKDKSKIEMISPMKQITITNDDKMAIINPETGQKMVQDLSKMKGKVNKGKSEVDLEKAMEHFNLTVKQSKDGQYIISGIPKKKSSFLTKMEFYVDPERWVPIKILMYGAQNKLLSKSDIVYEKNSGIWVPIKNVSMVNTPAGKMDVEMVFENIKINKGISDKEFAISE